jgi:hypothetical protein
MQPRGVRGSTAEVDHVVASNEHVLAVDEQPRVVGAVAAAGNQVAIVERVPS